MIIYKAENKITNEIYIGLTTTTLQKRKKRHFRSMFCGSKTKFHSALKTYGIKNFKWCTLRKCKTIEELIESEKELIKEYNSLLFGYNSTKGGELPKIIKDKFIKKENNKKELTADEYTDLCIYEINKNKKLEAKNGRSIKNSNRRNSRKRNSSRNS